MPRWIQHPITHELIPADEYVRPDSVNGVQAPHIMKPLDAFISPIDGQVIRDRAQLRRHNEKHGVTNLADYSTDNLERARKRFNDSQKELKRSRIDDIKHAIEKHSHN